MNAAQVLWWGNLLLGVGLLLPWNALLSAFDLWAVLFMEPHPQFMFIFSICYNSMAVPGLLVMLALGNKARPAVLGPIFFGVNAVALALLGSVALIPGMSEDFAFYSVRRPRGSGHPPRPNTTTSWATRWSATRWRTPSRTVCHTPMHRPNRAHALASTTVTSPGHRALPFAAHMPTRHVCGGAPVGAGTQRHVSLCVCARAHAPV